jgi:hypothetical protein
VVKNDHDNTYFTKPVCKNYFDEAWPRRSTKNSKEVGSGNRSGFSEPHDESLIRVSGVSDVYGYSVS